MCVCVFDPCVDLLAGQADNIPGQRRFLQIGAYTGLEFFSACLVSNTPLYIGIHTVVSGRKPVVENGSAGYHVEHRLPAFFLQLPALYLKFQPTPFPDRFDIRKLLRRLQRTPWTCLQLHDFVAGKYVPLLEKPCNRTEIAGHVVVVQAAPHFSHQTATLFVEPTTPCQRTVCAQVVAFRPVIGQGRVLGRPPSQRNGLRNIRQRGGARRQSAAQSQVVPFP